MVQVGIFVFGFIKYAIVEVGLAPEVRNALPWTVVIVRNRKNFLIAGLEFGDGHGSILAETFVLIVEIRPLHSKPPAGAQ
jgi:hypothetical protein